MVLVAASRPWIARTPASADTRFAQYNPCLIHVREYRVRYALHYHGRRQPDANMFQ